MFWELYRPEEDRFIPRIQLSWIDIDKYFNYK